MFLAHKPRSEKQSGSLSYGLVVAFFALVGLMIVATPFLPYLSDYASPSIAWQVLESLAAIQKSLQSGQEKAVGFVSPTKFDQAAVLAAESDQSLYIVLDSNWNISIKGDLTADQIVSTSPVSSPLIVSSNKEVANLNANYLQGKTANDFLSKDAFSTVTLQPTDQIFLGTSSLYYLKGDGSGHFKDLIVLGSVSLPNDSVVDAYIPNTITASNYLPLAGGTMTGGITFVSGQDFALGDSGSSINFDEVASSGTLPDLYLETISRAGKVSDTALSTNIAKLDTAQTFSANKTFSAKAYFGGTTYYLDSSGNAYLLDVHLGAIGLTDTASATTSGAYVIGTYDEFSNSASANVQDVLDDLDAAITTGGGSSMWSLSSGTVYPTLATTDFVVGADTLSAPFSVDESANTVRIGEGSNSDAILNMYSASGATGSIVYSQNDAWGFIGGNVGVGTTAPKDALDVSGSSAFGTLPTTALPMANSAYFSGNVGIGTTNPTYKLDVNGDIRIASGSDLHLGTTGLTDVASATSSGAYLIGTFDEFGNSSSANVQDVLDDLDSAIASGGVGSMWTLSSSVISPSSVTNDLAVGSATLVAPFSVDESANTVRIGEGSGSNAVINMYSSNNDTGSITYTGDDRFLFSNGSVEFGSSYFTGNLDMGNQSILNAAALNSKASQYLLMIGWGDSSEAFRVNYANGNGAWIWYGGASTPLVTFNDSGDGGYVGIGTSAQKNKLDVSGSVAFGSLPTTALPQANSAYFSGNVGIGTTNPAYTLDVNGNIRAAAGSDVYIGNIGLTDIASGTTSGAYLIGTFDEFIYSDSANVQDVLDDFDAAIGVAGSASGWTDGGSSVYLTVSADNIGIGTSTPLNKLDVAGSVAFGSPPTTALPQANSAYFSGNVGIGTTNPIYTVDINGDARIAAGSDLHIGNVGIGDTASGSTSGAYLVGTFDEFSYSNATNVQDVLDDLDAAITTAQVWTRSTTTLSPTTNTDDVGIGGTGPEAPIFLDASEGQVVITGEMAINGAAVNAAYGLSGNFGVNERGIFLQGTNATEGSVSYGLYFDNDVTGNMANNYAIYEKTDSTANDNYSFGFYSDVDISGATGSTYSGHYINLDTSMGGYYRGMELDFDNTAGSSTMFYGLTAEMNVTGIASTATGLDLDLVTATGATVQYLYGIDVAMTMHNMDTAYGVYVIDASASSGGTEYGVYLDLNDANVPTRWAIYTVDASANSAFLDDVFIGSATGYGSITPDGSGDLYVAGDFEVDGSAYGTFPDYAEMIAAESGLEAGDVLVVDDSKKETVKKSSSPSQLGLVGIVSTQPGFVLASTSGGVPMALAGRVPVKVCGQNGPITAGDYLTSSSQPGVAMKANAKGPTIGKALEDWPNPDPSTIGKIQAFVNVSWYDPGSSGTLSGSGKFEVGTETLRVENKLVSEASRILVTATTKTSFVISVTGKEPGAAFTVSLSSPAPEPISFDFWIVN